MTEYHVVLSKTVYLSVRVDSDSVQDAIGDALYQAELARAVDATFEDGDWDFSRVLANGELGLVLEIVP